MKKIVIMLLALSILYFKKDDFLKAEDYLKRLARTNKDTKTFFKELISGDLDRHLKDMNSFGYRPYTIEEFMMAISENDFLFEFANPYIVWADMRLRKRK